MRQKLADLINIIFGLRKFIAWIALFLVAIVFRLTSYVDGSQFVDLIKNTFLAFCASNGVEHIVSVAKEYVNVKGQALASSDEVSDNGNLVSPDKQ